MATVFVDRDGVINANRPDYVGSLDQLRFLPGAVDALVRLSDAGHRLFIVTNQAAVGRGLLTMEEAWSINWNVVETIRRAGGVIEGVLMCTHRPDHSCSCRKPRPGLLMKAREEYGVDLETSFLIGDHWTDIAAGAAAGSTPILVLSGRWRQSSNGERVAARYVVQNLPRAVELVQSLTSGHVAAPSHAPEQVAAGSESRASAR